MIWEPGGLLGADPGSALGRERGFQIPKWTVKGKPMCPFQHPSSHSVMWGSARFALSSLLSSLGEQSGLRTGPGQPQRRAELGGPAVSLVFLEVT